MPSQDLRLLALDGGGVRGLSSLMILEQLMEAINPNSPPKPCEYFDMIGGTSTGGLIAIMLGRLKMGITDCIEAYLLLSDQVFQKRSHRVTVRGSIQGRFDSGKLERVVKEVITKQGLEEDALLEDVTNDACKVLVCATRKETTKITCFTSYRSSRRGNDLLKSVKIWEACRATSAASSFFDPIKIGRYGEEFVDGATGANNPVQEVWNEAQQVWGSPLEAKIKCLVSIGTGRRLGAAFKDDIFNIRDTLIAIATDTKQKAEQFRRDKAQLDKAGQYYRFNVDIGLEHVGLEESKKKKDIAAATRDYMESQEILNRMDACANNVARNEPFRRYKLPFSLEGIPRIGNFVERLDEMAKLHELLPQRQNCPQKIFVLHGLGGIGKTQLAVGFARLYREKFDSVFWLDGRSEDSLKQSFASCAARIPQGQISEMSSKDPTGGSSGLEPLVEVMRKWLSQKDNDRWLLIFDNIDQDYSRRDLDPKSYNIKRYFPTADHGSILITTRLAKLQRLGKSHQVSGVSKKEAEAIIQKWDEGYEKKHDSVQFELLFDLLKGLPLAIAQAGAYLSQSGQRVEKYLNFYEERWGELVGSRYQADADEENTVRTTWTISYQDIQERNPNVANLLLLWAFFDNKGLWHGIFKSACKKSRIVEERLLEWIGDIATDEFEFDGAMCLLRNYSLIEDTNNDNSSSYAIHPVVHRWAYHFASEETKANLAHLAVTVVGHAVPPIYTWEYWKIQRQLLPHAQACTPRVSAGMINSRIGSHNTDAMELDNNEVRPPILVAIEALARLYRGLGKRAEAKEMYEYELHGLEEGAEEIDPDSISTFITKNELGTLYAEGGNLVKSEEMCNEALEGMEKEMGPDHELTLEIVSSLGSIYSRQGRLSAALKMRERAMQGAEKNLGPDHISTSYAARNLGDIYILQGRRTEAEKLYRQALQGMRKELGPDDMSTLDMIEKLGRLYACRNRLAKADKMYERALKGYEKNVGLRNIGSFKRALDTRLAIGSVWLRQGKTIKAEDAFTRALSGYKTIFGVSSKEYQDKEKEVKHLPALIWMAEKGEMQYTAIAHVYELTLSKQVQR